jgi:hypothetical protein
LWGKAVERGPLELEELMKVSVAFVENVLVV